MVVKYGIFGKITEGENSGCYVKIVDDRKGSGGFYIYEFKDLNGDQGFDTWHQTEKDVKGYVYESEWKIEWLNEVNKL